MTTRDILLGAWALVVMGLVLGVLSNRFARAPLPILRPYLKIGSAPQVSIATGHWLLANGALFVDARQSSQFRALHIQGALNLPSSDYATQFANHQMVLKNAKQLVVYCDNRNSESSQRVTESLLAAGFKAVYLMPEGIEGWKQAGHPFQEGP